MRKRQSDRQKLLNLKKLQIAQKLPFYSFEIHNQTHSELYLFYDTLLKMCKTSTHYSTFIEFVPKPYRTRTVPYPYSTILYSYSLGNKFAESDVLGKICAT